MRVGFTAAVLCATAATLPSKSFAQWRQARAPAPTAQTAHSRVRSPIEPTVLSLVLPGAGQHALGQSRKWAYLALEVVGWAAYLERHGAGSDYRDRYRDFAWDGGRIQTLPRVDADFEYYERLSKWSRSGAFDADPAREGVQPEADPATYNGSIWDRASQIFLPSGQMVPETDPRYRSALAYYEERAYGTELLWDWGRSPGAQQELARLIEVSDDRFRDATTALGVVIANHLLSAVDAYLSGRGRTSRGGLRFVPSPGPRPGWFAVVRVGIGR